MKVPFGNRARNHLRNEANAGNRGCEDEVFGFAGAFGFGACAFGAGCEMRWARKSAKFMVDSLG